MLGSHGHTAGLVFAPDNPILGYRPVPMPRRWRGPDGGRETCLATPAKMSALASGLRLTLLPSPAKVWMAQSVTPPADVRLSRLESSRVASRLGLHCPSVRRPFPH